MALYRDTGVVLRTHKLGEADRIITIMTQGSGKVRAVAKGVRKTKSKFGARLEPTSYIALQLYEGRGDLDTVTQVESIDLFSHTRSDITRMHKAMAMLEAVDQLAQEHEPNARLFNMLVGGLQSLEKDSSATLVATFYWKLLAASGYEPVTEECVMCGSTDDLVAFAVEQGGVTCRNCRQGIPMTEQTRVLLHATLSGGLNAVLEVPVSNETHDLEVLATHAMEHHLERRLRAVHVIAE